MSNFEDIAHLGQLGKDLWRWPKSRASVMVGSGFSLNADPLPGVKRRFPTWRDLARSMFDQLHPPGSGETAQERETRFDRASPLRIASEYRAAFERTKLEQLIRTEIPDSHYRPGGLHRLLLELPWADVFTTNYDTLLENTEVVGRSYQLVVKPSELTTAIAPRIIKLHGSFPSQTPFVVTDEDYRAYPRRFAPFVNSVQQSLLENSFVLIGFSGEDPNFLQWTGWIRDELGENHAPIYLVGPLSLSNVERSLLASRGVTPIDLSPLFEGVESPNRVHAASIEWFLRSLATGRPPRPEKWPDLQARAEPPSRVPLARLGRPAPAPGPSMNEARTPLDPGVLRRVMERWQAERFSYPGWVVAQQGKRLEIWTATSRWIPHLFGGAKEFPAVDRILVYREIIWRLELSMAPLFEDWVEPIEKALDECLGDLTKGGACEPSIAFTRTQIDWTSEIAAAGLEVAFALLREARESYDAVRWTALKARIDQILPQHETYANRGYYEAALWEVWNVDHQSAKEILSTWQPSPSPLALMWKAGLLAELDETADAAGILRTALQEVRMALRVQGQSMEILSLEGWCTYLISAVENSLNFTNPRAAGEPFDFTKYTEIRDEFWERWQELKAWDCSPWQATEYFDDVLSTDPPKLPKQTEETSGFDPGDVTVSFHFASSIDQFLPGFACIRLFERVGIPMRLPAVDVASKRLKNACLWVAPFNGFLSPALLIRAGKQDDISRPEVALMDPAFAGRIHNWCMRVLTRAIPSIPAPIGRPPLQVSLLKVCAETLSRLAFTVDTPELKASFALALRCQRLPAARAYLPVHEATMDWFRRLFDAADNALLIEWLPVLIQEPIPEEGFHPYLLEPDKWPEPLAHFPTGRLRGSPEVSEDLAGKVGEPATRLLRKVAIESGRQRQWALRRLIQVYSSDWMTIDQQRQIGELLWSETTENGLPRLPRLAVWALLDLPAPSHVDVPSIVKRYILNITPRNAISRDASGGIVSTFWVGASLLSEASSASKPLVRLGNEPQSGVEWTSAEATKMFHKVLDWWANDKAAFEVKNIPFSGISNPVLSELRMLSSFLTRAVLPWVSWPDEIERRKLVTLLDEVRAAGAFPTQVLPFMLLHWPGDFESVWKAIDRGLNSDAEGDAGAAAGALRDWVHLSGSGSVQEPPPALLDSLVHRVIFRRNPDVARCLKELALLVAEKPHAVDAAQAALLTESLATWKIATKLASSDEPSGEFYYTERPVLQAAAGMLAGALGFRHARLAEGAPEAAALAAWRDLCAGSRLPEVRRAFKFVDQLNLGGDPDLGR